MMNRSYAFPRFGERGAFWGTDRLKGIWNIEVVWGTRGERPYISVSLYGGTGVCLT